MYKKEFLELASSEIQAQIIAMPRRFTSFDFYTAFEQNYKSLYGQFIAIYKAKGKDEPHARQTVNILLMHTINDRFHHLARKAKTVPNPKGGNQSEWEK